MVDEEAVELSDKLARAAQLLFFKHHREPGARGWELRKALGRNYLEIVKLFDQEIQKLGLTVKRCQEEEGPDMTRFYVALRGHPSLTEARTFGWRIDDMAMLTVIISFILSRRGKAPLKDVERVLREKFPKWRVEYNVDRFIRMGYLSEDDAGMLYLGWRTMAEVDQKELLSSLIGKEGEGKPSADANKEDSG